MLFNSYQFILLFLPIAFAGFYVIARVSRYYAIVWLACSSLVFYGFWNPRLVLLLLASATFNYIVGYALARSRRAIPARILLASGVAVNLGLLAYYKYANFFLSTVSAIFAAEWTLTEIVLPLAISFFTFTQIAFLVDVYRRETREDDFVRYLLFISYFPHLIAGPILRHKEVMPQFRMAATYRISAENVAYGLALFTFGLAKKVLLADRFAEYATPVFDSGQDGAHLTCIEYWIGAVAYSFQLYFDFSGYSDMAIGLSRLFGVRLPFNFNSPYKAWNIIEFWRRWHMTLSRFLRDYLYVPLGGNRRGVWRRYANLMITMVLGGLWHGANWTFVAWGALHGLYLVVNYVWHALRRRIGFAPSGAPGGVGRVLGNLVTFAAITIAWVFFRADSIDSALGILRGMSSITASGDVQFEARESLLFLAGFIIVFLLPNSQRLAEVMNRGVGKTAAILNPAVLWGTLCGLLFGLSFMMVQRSSEFLYFQF